MARVAVVARLELVEAQEGRAAGDLVRDGGERVAELRLLLLQPVHLLVQPLHELVEVQPLLALLGHRAALEERVHQERLAAADPAVHVEPSRRAHGVELGLLPGGDARRAAAAAAAAGGSSAEHVTEGAAE